MGEKIELRIENLEGRMQKTEVRRKEFGFY
jgi:hypothetical protein